MDDEIKQIQEEIMKEKERMNGITPQEKHSKLVKEVCQLPIYLLYHPSFIYIY